MRSLLKYLAEKWNNWTGDHEMELAIRKHLTKNGYFGGTVQLENVRLVAVQRPGWLQIYRFDATARLQVEQSDGPDPDPVYHQLYGLVKDDIRHKMTIVRVFQHPAERRELYRRWAEGLIELRGAHGLG
ncbi:hypothetical protein [Rhodopirellula sp. MGV]|uniref:hypothetical protein n=1 Tax=Rhodopirellula sp. MGV TaxID=2023130 RepID=UPI000B95D1FD|nr:hypothetical protein [Rhodopirellula sp. MGV]OYP37685.1 hypothetical protein CGZ80_04145 [Rhodopirellula sp. MGV]PNY37123.1 hypothetical protein C2E31_09000 [Rhodopirellula baltica]